MLRDHVVIALLFNVLCERDIISFCSCKHNLHRWCEEWRTFFFIWSATEPEVSETPGCDISVINEIQ